MANAGGDAGFIRRSFRRISTRLRPPHLDRKKLGILGAPQCRCTPLVLALCIGLTGLIVIGCGSCMAGFMWQDDKPRGLGLALVGLGVFLMIGGVGICIYDSCVKSLMPTRTAMVYQDNNNISQPLTFAPPPVQAISTITNVRAMPSNFNHYDKMHSYQGTAPPPYDDYLKEDVRHGSSQEKRGRHQRPAAERGQSRNATRDNRGPGTGAVSSVV